MRKEKQNCHFIWVGCIYIHVINNLRSLLQYNRIYDDFRKWSIIYCCGLSKRQPKVQNIHELDLLIKIHLIYQTGTIFVKFQDMDTQNVSNSPKRQFLEIMNCNKYEIQRESERILRYGCSSRDTRKSKIYKNLTFWKWSVLIIELNFTLQIQVGLR